MLQGGKRIKYSQTGTKSDIDTVGGFFLLISGLKPLSDGAAIGTNVKSFARNVAFGVVQYKKRRY